MSRIEELERRLEELEKERDAYARALKAANAAFAEKVKEASIIKRIGDSVRWTLDKPTLCREIVDIIIDETIAENCSLWLVDPSRGFISLAAARGQSENRASYYDELDSRAGRMAMGEGAAGWVAKVGSPVLIKDTTKNKKRFKPLDTEISSSIRSLLCLPIFSKDTVIGVVNMSHPDVGAFSKENERALGLITNQAGLAFANIFLFDRLQNFNQKLERMVAERTRELSYSESKYRSFTEHAGDAILVIEREGGKIIEVNSRACEYTGYAKEELLGGDIEFLLTRELSGELRHILEKGNGRIDGYPMRRRSGEEFYTDITVNVIDTQSGEVAHMIVRDITHRRNLEARLREYSEHLEEMVAKRTDELREAQSDLMQASKLAAIGEISSGVAHEINNPIAVISGYVEDLIDRFKTMGEKGLRPEDVLWSLQLILSQVERCKEITKSLLDFTRRHELSVSSVNINQIVLQSIGYIERQIRGKRIEIRRDFDGSLPIVRTDASVLEQVLLNLYGNAVDAVSGSGAIITRTSHEGGVVKITVQDTGEGIPKDDLPKIFEPFYTTKPVGKGTGLGLSICQHLLERLQGRIDVESQPGHGTAFTITIPVNISTLENGEKGKSEHGESKNQVTSCR